MNRIVLFIVSMGLYAAPTVTIPYVSAQQAVMQIAGASGDCTLEVSTSGTYSPLIPDLTSPQTDIAQDRPNTITQGDGTLLVTLGFRASNRSLQALTTYYYRVTGCGTTATGTFATSNLGNGMTRTSATPTSASGWAQQNWPAIDWTDPTATYVDPVTGAKVWPIALSTRTYRTGGGSGGAVSGYSTITSTVGGTGWTNPGNIVNGSTSDAVTGNTNPLDLLINTGINPYEYYLTVEDLGIVAWGTGSSMTAADRQFTLDLRKHGSSCGTVTITAPEGSLAHIDSMSSDPDGAFPAAFPKNPYYGWTGSATDPCIHQEDNRTTGTATVSGSTLTIASPTYNDHFSSALVAGDYVYVSNSSPGCTNNICTVASSSGPTSLTLNETPSNAGSQTYIAYGWIVRVTKNNANGTVGIGLKWKIAGSTFPYGVGNNSTRCSPVQVTSGDAKDGHLCTFATLGLGSCAVLFVPNDETPGRVVWDQMPTCSLTYDDTEGNVMYVGSTNGTNGLTVIKYTYTGDYTENIDYAYGCGTNLVCPTVMENVTSEDLMPNNPGTPAQGNVGQQISANFPGYDDTLYGAFSSVNAAFYGSSGHIAVFARLYSGQGQAGDPTTGGPGWIAIADLSTSPALIVALCHTLTGEDLAGYADCSQLRFGSLHNIQALTSYSNTVFISMDPLDARSTSTLHGGPYEAAVTGVLEADESTWDTNTCLDYPTNSGNGCAHRGTTNASTTCPMSITPYTQCVTLRMVLPSGYIPNVSATAAEITAYPCSGSHPTWSCPALLLVDDNGIDNAGGRNWDWEHFRILSITNISGEDYKVVVARNATYEYCSRSPWQGQTNPYSAQAEFQLYHDDGWAFSAAAGNDPTVTHSCEAPVALLNFNSTPISQILGRDFTLHGGLAPAPTSGNVSYVTPAAIAYNQAFVDISQVPPVLKTLGDPTFAGYAGSVGVTLQAYPGIGQYSSAANLNWASDFNALVGCAAESFGCTPAGGAHTLTSVTGDIYRITVSGTAMSEAAYKTLDMIGQAGRYSLIDISGPGSDITATAFTMCHVIAANECYTGSSANQIYINVPRVYDPGNYFQPGQSWANNPGVFLGLNAPATTMKQYRISTDDANGIGVRGVYTAFTPIGSSYPYAATFANPTANFFITEGTHTLAGHELIALAAKLPTFEVDSVVRNDFIDFPVSIPSGDAYARVRFGYADYGDPGDFLCSQRNDPCVTDDTTAPYAYLNTDSLDPTSTCTSGCTINIPTLPMRVVYYRVERSTDGMMWDTSGDIYAITTGAVEPAPPAAAAPVFYGAPHFIGPVVIHAPTN